MNLNVDVVTEKELLEHSPRGESFKVLVDGELESFLGKARCAYFEWICGRRDQGELVQYSVAYHSSSPLVLTVKGKRATVSLNRVRVHVNPSVERDYQPQDQAAPDLARQFMAKHGAGAYVAEFRLDAGRTYHAAVAEERFLLPPEGPGKPPREERQLVLRISDEAFEGGEPRRRATPYFRGWAH